MGENEVIQDAAPQAAEQSPMNFFQRLGGVYFEPQKTFEDINRKPSWLGIFLIAAALIATSSYVLTIRMDRETLLRKSLQMSPWTRNLPEDQIKTILAQPQSAFQRYSSLIFAPVGALVGYLIIAGVLLLAFVLVGAQITYKKSLTMAIWGMAPPGILLTLLGILFMYLKDPEALEINPANNVASNLSMLVSAKEHPVLESLLGSIDLFSFWTIFLLSIAFTAISEHKLSVRKSATVIVVLWAIWVLGKAGFFAIFG